MDALFNDMQSKGMVSMEKQYYTSSSLTNIVDFIYIMRYCEPMYRDRIAWQVKAHCMMLEGGSSKVTY